MTTTGPAASCMRCGARRDVPTRFCTRCGALATPPADSPAVAPVPFVAAPAQPAVAPAELAPWATSGPSRGGRAGLAAGLALLLAGVGAGAYLLSRSEDTGPSAAPNRAETPAGTAAPAPSVGPTAMSSPPAPVGPSRDLTALLTADTPVQADDGTDAAGAVVSYGAAHLLDDDPTTCWRTAGDASGRTVVLRLPAPHLVTSLGLVNGYAKTDPRSGDDRYAQERRITAVTWLLPDGASVRQQLADGVRTVQSVPLPTPVRADEVRLRIDATIPAGDAAYDYTAISSVSVQGR